MKFERGKDPMASMGIGRDAHMKKIILNVVKGMKETQHPSLRDKENEFKWQMWTRGIEVHHIEKILDPEGNFIYKFFYQDCNGEEAHIMRNIQINEDDLSDYVNS